ncbi:MAG TPA: hypothetical protein VE178_20385 [Silvibacterium sp.]|jgi:hypothetical protein|nr:hypothetical protein [Silvibacterium sp.]
MKTVVAMISLFAAASLPFSSALAQAFSSALPQEATVREISGVPVGWQKGEEFDAARRKSEGGN